MKEYRSLFLFTITFFIVGIIFGMVLVHSLPLSQQDRLLENVNQFFEDQRTFDAMDAKDRFWEPALQHVKIVATILFLGLSVIGVPIILVIIFAKGMLIGFTSVFFIKHMSNKGFFVLLFQILPHNILEVPALIFLTVASIAFALFIIRNRLVRFYGKMLPALTSYLVICVACLSILILSSLIESFVAPILLEKSAAYILN